MLSPALAAVQFALNPLLIGAATAVVVVAALYWLGLRNPGRRSVDTQADASPGGDSDFAPEAPVAAPQAQRSGALPAAALPRGGSTAASRCQLCISADQFRQLILRQPARQQALRTAEA